MRLSTNDDVEWQWTGDAGPQLQLQVADLLHSLTKLVLAVVGLSMRFFRCFERRFPLGYFRHARTPRGRPGASPHGGQTPRVCHFQAAAASRTCSAAVSRMRRARSGSLMARDSVIAPTIVERTAMALPAGPPNPPRQ